MVDFLKKEDELKALRYKILNTGVVSIAGKYEKPPEGRTNNISSLCENGTTLNVERTKGAWTRKL